MKRAIPPVEPLNGRELGGMLAAVEGDSWRDKRNVAILNIMARAGLRVSEVVNLRLDDIELNHRKGLVQPCTNTFRFEWVGLVGVYLGQEVK